MDIGVVGINHHLAPIEVREKFSFTESMKIEGSSYLLDEGINEVTIVSTCNRSEIYISSDDIEESIDKVVKFYGDFFKQEIAREFIFTRSGKDAVDHIFMVASGLDSIVIGEDQILGQIRDAMISAMELGFSKKILNKLFMEAVGVGKKIRHTLKISEIPLSTSYIGISLLKKSMGSLEGKKALVIGAGEISSLAVKYLDEENLDKIYLTNRSHGKIGEVFGEYEDIKSINYRDRHQFIKHVDFIITATAAPHTVIRAEDMPRLDNRIWILDLGLPRDVDGEVGGMNNVTLYHIDDLKEVSEENMKKREQLSKEAMVIIEKDVEKFTCWLKTIEVDPVIQSLNIKCSQIKNDTMDYINRKLDLDKREEKIIDKMIMSALKTIIREPIKVMKEADEDNVSDYMETVKKLFEI